jgi:hypothetical protein
MRLWQILYPRTKPVAPFLVLLGVALLIRFLMSFRPESANGEEA